MQYHLELCSLQYNIVFHQSTNCISSIALYLHLLIKIVILLMGSMQYDNNIMVLLHRSVTSEICKELKDRFYQGDIYRNSEAS